MTSPVNAIVLGVANVVAVSALPVTLPVKSPSNDVAVTTPVKTASRALRTPTLVCPVTVIAPPTLASLVIVKESLIVTSAGNPI